MIVVDENIHASSVIEGIASWYSGQVVSITSLRPQTIIKDDIIPSLLLKANQPTFITINAVDFWRKVHPHPGYCIVAMAFPKERQADIPLLLRNFFRLPEFRTKASRMGKITRLTDNTIEYYESGQTVNRLSWTAK